MEKEDFKKVVFGKGGIFGKLDFVIILVPDVGSEQQESMCAQHEKSTKQVLACAA